VFAEKLAADGFAFLDAPHPRARHRPGAHLPAGRQDRRGHRPMEIMPDSQGVARLLPQYFGVLPGYRGLGLDRSLDDQLRAALQ
jgi:hypothetical protein